MIHVPQQEGEVELCVAIVQNRCVQPGGLRFGSYWDGTGQCWALWAPSGHSPLSTPDLPSALQAAVSAGMLLAWRQLCALTIR